MKKRLKRNGVCVAVLAMILPMLGISPAYAVDGDILPPFDVGQTWYICQGYNGPVTHSGTSQYGLDLTGSPGCGNGASGRNARAPLGGMVAYYQSAYGNLCINTSGGRSYTLSHINASVMSGNVSPGQIVGTVATPGQRGNNGVSHIHLQLWSASGCYNGPGVPFDSAQGSRICGAPNLTTAGPSTGNGTWSGTSFVGSTCGVSSSASLVVFQANNGALWMYSNVTDAGGGTTLGLASGTSPAIYGSTVVFQANTGQLWTYNTDTGVDINLGLGMKPGTSPVIYGSQVFFQSNTGHLWRYDMVSGQNASTTLGMMAGTSPAISGNNVVFQANNGALWTYDAGTWQAGGTTLGMMAGTSPAVSGNNVVFQANNGALWLYNIATGQSQGTTLGMMAGTNPAISGTKVVFQSNGGYIWNYDTSTGQSYGTIIGMKAGTSPAISGTLAVFHANTGMLWKYDVATGQNFGTTLGMNAGTSPVVSP